MNLEIKKLNDLAIIIMGQSPASKFYNELGDGMPFFQGKTEFGEIYPSIRKYTTKTTRLAKVGYILFTVRAPVGDINIANVDCCLGRGLASIDSKENNRFLFYLLKNSKSLFLSKSSGTIYDSINKDDLKNVVFQIPSARKEREAIASILSAYDDLIENNTRRIAILEEMAQMIYREWFVRFRFPDHEKIKRVDSPLGKIPKGWEVKKLGDMVELAYGKALKASDLIEGDFPVYGSGGVIGTHNESLVDGPGIIVGRKGNVGSVFWSNKDFFPIDTAFFIRTELSLFYVYFNLQEQNFLNSDAAVPGLSRNQAYQNHFLVPDSKTINSFEEFIIPVFQQNQILKQKNITLRQTRDLLLPKLISGELDVSDLDIKIPEREGPELQASAGGMK